MATTKLSHVFTDGDRLPELFGTYKGVDLTGQTVTLTLERPADVLTKTATLVDASAGRFKFSWAVGDIVTGQGQRGTIRVTDGSGLKTTISRFLLDVQAAA
jgi:hypothetical protein